MVGRPKPVYVPYIPKDKPEEKKKKEKSVEWDEDELDFEIEHLEKERQKLLKKSEIRGIKGEMFELEHPRIVSGEKRVGKAAGRLASFAGGLLKEGTRGIRRTRRTKGLRTIRPTQARPRTRATDDISLTRAIAMNDWSGSQDGLMERQFFASDDHERNLLGDRNAAVNIGSNFEQDFFGEKKDIDLLGGTSKLEVDGKKKQIRYI